MANTSTRSELLTQLASVADAHHVTVTSKDDRAVSGTQEAITSKWFLGGRKVVYQMTCQLDEASRTARLREIVTESSWGVPPPSFTVEKTTQRGTRVSESRTDRGGGGGGKLDYGGLRAAFEQATRAAGWQFAVEAGKMP